MKKYRVTEQHPFLKNGIVRFSNEHISFDSSDNYTYLLKFYGYDYNYIKIWLTAGWIEEIQEPKWTDSDMINFANELGLRSKDETIHDIFRKFKKSKDEKEN